MHQVHQEMANTVGWTYYENVTQPTSTVHKANDDQITQPRKNRWIDNIKDILRKYIHRVAEATYLAWNKD